MLERLRLINEFPIKTIEDDSFRYYGRVLKQYDFNELLPFMEKEAIEPTEGNCYYPSISKLEDTRVKSHLEQQLYGGQEIQIGYCNGNSTELNGLEYHKCSEVTVAVTEMVLMLGYTWDIVNNQYDTSKVEVFYLRKGDAVELFQTTLHFAPSRVQTEIFKSIIILTKGTNTDLITPVLQGEGEERLLFKKNKWLLAHPEREILVKQGVYPGLIGKNLKVEIVKEGGNK